MAKTSWKLKCYTMVADWVINILDLCTGVCHLFRQSNGDTLKGLHFITQPLNLNDIYVSTSSFSFDREQSLYTHLHELVIYFQCL